MAKRSDLAPLDAIRLVLKSCTIKLEPLTHQINALPEESGLEYHFVSAENMKMFSPYHRLGQPYRNLKLVNFDRPAIALTFFIKHKYTIERSVKPEQGQEVLREYRDQLYKRLFIGQLATEQQELQHIDTLLRAMRQTPDKFQLCISNYHHYYRYWYCSFRYFEDMERTKTGTHNEHMLKYTHRVGEHGQEPIVNERLNIVFVDMNYITRPVPYDNKMIDRELETYSDRIVFGKGALYVRSIE